MDVYAGISALVQQGIINYMQDARHPPSDAEQEHVQSGSSGCIIVCSTESYIVACATVFKSAFHVMFTLTDITTPPFALPRRYQILSCE